MSYLIFDKYLRVLADIVNEEPIEHEDYIIVPTSDFKIDDKEKYTITINANGVITSELKPLAERKAIQLERENQQQGIELSEREIQEIIQGVQISELEIQLLELQLGGV